MTIITLNENKYTVVFNYSALKSLEAEGVNIMDMSDGLTISDIAIMLKAGLYKHHKLTLVQVEELMDEVLESEGFTEGMASISRAIEMSLSGKK